MSTAEKCVGHYRMTGIINSNTLQFVVSIRRGGHQLRHMIAVATHILVGGQ